MTFHWLSCHEFALYPCLKLWLYCRCSPVYNSVHLVSKELGGLFFQNVTIWVFFLFRVYAALVMVSDCLIHSEYSVFKIYELNMVYLVYLLPLLRKKSECNGNAWVSPSPHLPFSRNTGIMDLVFHIFMYSLNPLKSTVCLFVYFTSQMQSPLPSLFSVRRFLWVCWIFRCFIW